MIKKQIYPLFLIFVSLWWAWTFLVDFFVVREVFTHISDFFAAGDLGIALFTKVNRLELIAASVVLALAALSRSKLFTLLSLTVFALAILYFALIIPKISLLTELWKAAEAKGSLSAGRIPDIQQEHQFYHRLYIFLDTVKLLILTAMLPLAVWRKESLS